MRLPTILVIQHSAQEAPTRLGGWLRDAGLLLDVRTPYDGTPLPDLDGYAGLVVLGGQMAAWEDDVAPWLPRTRDLLRAAVADGVPTLGVCLGGQLLALATGGTVERGPDGPEVGPGLVAKRDVSAGDELFRGLPFTPDVINWHWDAVTRLPPGATLLASSVTYPNHAFRVGEVAYGLQFHIETTPDLVRAWAAGDAAALAAIGVDVDAVLERWDLDEVHRNIEETWQPFTRRFAELVRRIDFARTEPLV